jgi:hypothetical protein
MSVRQARSDKAWGASRLTAIISLRIDSDSIESRASKNLAVGEPEGGSSYDDGDGDGDTAQTPRRHGADMAVQSKGLLIQHTNFVSISNVLMVGATGIEPVTPAMSTQCSYR